MKKLWLLLLCFPLMNVAQAQSKKAKLKADKTLTANLQTHIQYLENNASSNSTETTELPAVQYLEKVFEKYKLMPKGDSGYVQAFSLNQGKQFSSADNYFSVNGEKMKAKTDYYPLAFSANSIAKGSVSPLLREENQIWFWNVADVLDDNTANKDFDIMKAVLKEAKRDAAKGAKALIIYNSSNLADNILFEANDSAEAVSIPVIYLTQHGMQQYFPDATNIYDLDLNVDMKTGSGAAYNVIGYLNFNASNTILISAPYNHLSSGAAENSNEGHIQDGDDNASGTAALLELARILYNSKAQSNNYIFISYSGEESGMSGLAYWQEHESADVNINYMINIDRIGNSDSLTIGGYKSSPSWSQVFETATDPKLVTNFNSNAKSSFLYNNTVPVLLFSSNSNTNTNKINYKGETEIVDYIVNIIKAADAAGKLNYAKPDVSQLQ